MANVKVTQKRNDSTEIVFSGELNIYSVMDTYQAHLKEITYKPTVIFKLAKIEEVDTAGIQLLLSIIKSVLAEGGQFQISSTSHALRDYCELFNLPMFMSGEVQTSMEYC